MATQTILFGAASGLTISTVRLFSGTSDTVIATTSATERTNAKGIYSADYTDLSAGLYRLIALTSGGIPVCQWWVRCAGGTSTAHATETPDATEWTQIRAGYMDAMLQAANSNQRTVQVTGSNHVAADVHAFQADVIDAAAIAADAVTEIQSGLATATALATLTGYVDTEVAAIKVVTDRISTGLVADGAVWQFTANMLELAPAGGGGGAGDASQTTLLEVQDTVESIAASLSGVPVVASGRIAEGGTITIYCGDDLRVRSGSQITITVTDVGGAIYTRLDGIGSANLLWGASRQGLPASAIAGTIASLSQSGSGASQTMTIVVEIDNAGATLRPAEDYTWQIESLQDHGAEADTVVEMEGLLSLRRRVV